MEETVWTGQHICIAEMRLAESSYRIIANYLQGPWRTLGSLRARPEQLRRLSALENSNSEETDD